ncbi:hypothetical protein COJ21_22460 [Priestia megaterium]|uniref:hypothetical protein n=1 Tax=Priestia megaterium TaxID=1404 RepID=UPI000BF336F9|nr:hypothetical protein [Priestia megaterium]PFK69357.1 hypothetical protein COJ21_22460 [Priestia megaterium]
MENEKDIHQIIREMNMWKRQLASTANFSPMLEATREIRKNLLAATTVSRELFRATRITAFELTKEFREMRSALQGIIKLDPSLPYLNLYQDIIKSIDDDTYEKIKDIWDDSEPDEFESDEEEVRIVRPAFYNAAVNLNIYINITEDHVHNNVNNPAQAEEKNIWDKVLKPVLGFVLSILVTLALSTDPLSDMFIVKEFSKVIEVINEHMELDNG